MKANKSKLSLGGVFGNGAVLQCGVSIPVWGRAEANALVECAIGGIRRQVRASADGDFLLRLPPLAPGGPHELRLQDMECGENVVLQDIMLGEVWLASGQSNMELPLKAIGAKAEECRNPNVRFFNVECRTEINAARNVPGCWKSMLAEDNLECSGVAYYFAKKLADELGIAVGIINASRGASRIEAWIPREALAGMEYGRELLQEYEAELFLPETWEQYYPGDDPEKVLPDRLERLFDFKNLPVFGIRHGWHLPGTCDYDWKEVTLPGDFDSMGFHGNGAIWLRREFSSDATEDLEIEFTALGECLCFVNGEKVEEGIIPCSILKKGANLLAFRIYAPLGRGGIDAAPEFLSGPWRMRVEIDLTRTREVAPGLPPEERFHAMMRAFMPYMSYAGGGRMIRAAGKISGPGIWNSPHILFDNMIRPLIPYALRGVIWYQGESNCDNPQDYNGLMQSLIHAWRRNWEQGDFPFYQTQLAAFSRPEPYDEGSAWARLREAQWMASDAAGSGCICLIDAGSAETIHPQDKKTPGYRLAALALADTYGKDIPAYGPCCREMRLEQEAIRLFFDYAAGLHGSGGFYLAGKDRRFHPAEAKVEGQCLIVRSEAVPEPEYVRYGWADNPAGSDFRNRDGLPMIPFRTDKFD